MNKLEKLLEDRGRNKRKNQDLLTFVTTSNILLCGSCLLEEKSLERIIWQKI